MSGVGGWTGRSASALQSALRLSNEKFAEKLGIGARTVASWHQKPDLRPQSEMQQVLDTAYERASDAERARFAELTGDGPAVHTRPDTKEADRRLAADPTSARPSNGSTSTPTGALAPHAAPSPSRPRASTRRRRTPGPLAARGSTSAT